MTAFEFIYLIGFNVSFLMALCVFINDDELKKENDNHVFVSIVCALIIGILSWGLIIYYMMKKHYSDKAN